jgi:exonuclease VII small subunit
MDGDVPKEFAIEIWQRGGSLLKRCEELVLIQEQMCISTADAVTLRYHFGRPRTEWND